MLGNMSGPTLIVILFIVLLLFGAPKLPALAKSLGQSMKILKKEVAPEDGGATPASSEKASESVKDEEPSMEEKLAKAEADAERLRKELEAKNDAE